MNERDEYESGIPDPTLQRLKEEATANDMRGFTRDLTVRHIRPMPVQLEATGFHWFLALAFLCVGSALNPLFAVLGAVLGWFGATFILEVIWKNGEKKRISKLSTED